MLSPNEQADRFSQELDRYFLAATDLPQELPPEDEPELSLGVQLIQADLSHQSMIRTRLRHTLVLENGILPVKSAQKLVQAASRRRAAFPNFWNFWPGLLALVVIICFWSWTSATSSNPQDLASLPPTPIIITTTASQAAIYSLAPDPMPVPTPLAPYQTVSYHSSTTPAKQLTPFRLPITSTEVTNH